MPVDFKILKWDADFFNFKVARIRPDTVLQNDLFEALYNENVHLAYYSSQTKLPDIFSQYFTVDLVDEKLCFVKEIEQSNPSAKIKSYKEPYPNNALLTLALESGVYSRFNVDPKVGREKFESLYIEWITKSVAREIADDVLIYEVDGKIGGFVTIGQKNEKVDIGIIAVDKEYRGLGIGKELMKAAENLMHGAYNSIQVITQGRNAAAIRLYKSCGYLQEEVSYTYHLWKK